MWKTARKNTRRIALVATTIVVLYALYKWDGSLDALPF
jgi:hypothetical protein